MKYKIRQIVALSVAFVLTGSINAYAEYVDGDRESYKAEDSVQSVESLEGRAAISTNVHATIQRNCFRLEVPSVIRFTPDVNQFASGDYNVSYDYKVRVIDNERKPVVGNKVLKVTTKSKGELVRIDENGLEDFNYKIDYLTNGAKYCDQDRNLLSNYQGLNNVPDSECVLKTTGRELWFSENRTKEVDLWAKIILDSEKWLDLEEGEYKGDVIFRATLSDSSDEEEEGGDENEVTVPPQPTYNSPPPEEPTPTPTPLTQREIETRYEALVERRGKDNTGLRGELESLVDSNIKNSISRKLDDIALENSYDIFSRYKSLEKQESKLNQIEKELDEIETEIRYYKLKDKKDLVQRELNNLKERLYERYGQNSDTDLKMYWLQNDLDSVQLEKNYEKFKKGKTLEEINNTLDRYTTDLDIYKYKVEHFAY